MAKYLKARMEEQLFANKICLNYKPSLTLTKFNLVSGEHFRILRSSCEAIHIYLQTDKKNSILSFILISPSASLFYIVIYILSVILAQVQVLEEVNL